MADLSKLSDEDLEALNAGDMSRVSDAGLSLLSGADEFADYDVTQDMSGTEQFLAGVGQGMTEMARGAGQLVGLVEEEDIVDARARDEDLLATGAGLAGSVAGKIALAAPTAMIPGAATIPGATAIGGGLGALEPVIEDESRLQNVGVSALVGGAAVPVIGAASSVLAPRISEAVQLLSREGVGTTIGQKMGGAFKSLEDKLTSVPLLGDKIVARRKESYEEFNEAAINRALEPVGEKLPKDMEPHQAVAYVRTKLGEKYDDLLGKMGGSIDGEFRSDVDNLLYMMKTLPEENQKYFGDIIKREINGRVTDTGKFSGQSLKDIETAIGREADTFAGGTGFERKLGEAFEELQGSFRRMLGRQNPEHARSLRNVNEGYANFKVVQNAASKIGTDEGLFSPAQLLNAVRAKDRSLDKRAFSEGTALMQDLAGAGKSVLPSAIPDSGTAGRMLASSPFSALLSMTAGLVPSVAYTKAGHAFTQGLMGYRPQALQMAGEALEATKPMAAPMTTGLMDLWPEQ